MNNHQEAANRAYDSLVVIRDELFAFRDNDHIAIARAMIGDAMEELLFARDGDDSE